MAYSSPNILRQKTQLWVPERGLRKPVRPTIDWRDPINGNLHACFLFGDKFQNPITQIAIAGEFTNSTNVVNMLNFAAASIEPNDRGGTGLRFNGSTTRIDMGVGYMAARVYPYSMRWRFKFSSVAAGTQNLMYEQSSGANGFQLSFNGTTLQIQINSVAANPNLNSIRSSWNTTTFVDVIFTMDGSNKGSLYIDGVLDNTQASMPNPLAAIDDTYIGCVHFSGGSTQSFFNGVMDIFQIWQGRAVGPEVAARLRAEPYAGILDMATLTRRGTPLKVAGTVFEGASPVAKTVAAYDTTSLGLLGSTTSSGVDGTYSIPVGSHGNVFVVAFDPTTFQAQIYDDVTPVPA